MHNSSSYALASRGQESKMTISYFLPCLKIMSSLIKSGWRLFWCIGLPKDLFQGILVPFVHSLVKTVLENSRAVLKKIR